MHNADDDRRRPADGQRSCAAALYSHLQRLSLAFHSRQKVRRPHVPPSPGPTALRFRRLIMNGLAADRFRPSCCSAACSSSWCRSITTLTLLSLTIVPRALRAHRHLQTARSPRWASEVRGHTEGRVYSLVQWGDRLGQGGAGPSPARRDEYQSLSWGRAAPASTPRSSSTTGRPFYSGVVKRRHLPPATANRHLCRRPGGDERLAEPSASSSSSSPTSPSSMCRSIKITQSWGADRRGPRIGAGPRLRDPRYRGRSQGRAAQPFSARGARAATSPGTASAFRLS